MRILIIKFGAIGDMVFVTPLIRELKQTASWLGVLTLPWSRSVLEANPHVDQLHLYDPWSVHGFSKLKMAYRISRELRQYRYDAAVILHRSLFAPILALASGITRRVGFHHSMGRFLLTTTVPFDPEQHEIYRNLRLLEAFGRSPDVSPQTEMYVRETELNKQNFPLRPRIGLFPGGGVNPGMSFPAKRWPLDHYLKLVRLLKREGIEMTIFGGESDRDLCTQLYEATGQSANCCVGYSLEQVAQDAKKCSLFVGGDSGPLHIAAAVGTPTLALFGPTDPRLVAPIGEKHHVLRLDLPCSPCYRLAKPTECVNQHHCLQQLEPARVYSAITELLAWRGGESNESSKAYETS